MPEIGTDINWMEYIIYYFGAYAISLIILIIVLWCKKKDMDKAFSEHREDRNEWIKTTQKQTDTVLGVVKNNTEALGKVEATMQMLKP